MQITDTKQMKNLIRQLNLDSLMWEELEDSGSPFSEFINAFTLNFIVKNLPGEKLLEFQNKLLAVEERIKMEGEEGYKGYEGVWEFLKENIADFEKRFVMELAQKIMEIRKRVVNDEPKGAQAI